jgi:hypothetical protein
MENETEDAQAVVAELVLTPASNAEMYDINISC